ncbi:hypothetical protein G7070_03920 [Propioniciclava coleopterorum]|uniref:Imm-5-like domain-containing protein n=1 Tax=Propioniciclava coleopterorum TaxID=2714937 RepID=A0A6G7Y4N4_9ACTN|nr:hypothetical protein [Propioniciclava coleopterorum]QIK71577.1 hypothetical protein G7070_03920 [Propioniciclava coleopterorum]
MASPQTLDDGDRRVLALWAADCAARVLPLFEAEAPDDPRVRDAIARTRAYGQGTSSAAAEIGLRMVAVKAAAAATSPAGAAAARSAAQASAVAHMGAHALGAAAYAVKAVDLARGAEAGLDEERRQLRDLTPEARAALARLPLLGDASGGPLGPGLLTRGLLGEVITRIQAAVAGDRDV